MGSGNHDAIVFNLCRVEGQSESRLVNIVTPVGVQFIAHLSSYIFNGSIIKQNYSMLELILILPEIIDCYLKLIKFNDSIDFFSYQIKFDQIFGSIVI